MGEPAPSTTQAGRTANPYCLIVAPLWWGGTICPLPLGPSPDGLQRAILLVDSTEARPLPGLVLLGDLFDDVEQFGAAVAALAAELDELDRLGEQCAALGCAADANPLAGPEFEQSFVA